MLRRRSVHKDMADFNGYTAKRLREMAESFAGLSKAFGGNSGETGLSREDGAAAMEAAAAMVCGSCEKCGIRGECRREDGEENYYLYYLLRTFEKKGAVDYEDMPRRFLETCRRKADYLGQLNRNLGRATMNLAWKSRFLESRDAVMVQFREMADILEEFSGRMEQAADVTAALEPEIRSTLWRRRVDMENLLVLQYANQKREIFMTARTTNGRCMTARDAAELLGRAAKGLFRPSRGGKTIITRNAASFRFVEEGNYRMLFGSARTPREGEAVSGDSYTFKNGMPGQAIMSLSDGMGSGEREGDRSDGTAFGNWIFRPRRIKACKYGPSAFGRRGASGNAGSVPGGSLFWRFRGDEAWSAGLLCDRSGIGGGAGIGNSSRRRFESCGTGLAV